MNKTAIKNFAIWARNKLIADVSYRAGLLGITDKEIKAPLSQSTKTMQFFDIGTAEPYSITAGAIRQRERLVDAIEQKAKADGYTIAYQNIIEEVAYTWFNRLIAIRFMEVNDYMPAHIRALSSDSGKMEPDIVTTPFDAELEFTSEEQQRVMQLKTDNQIDELFRMLFIKQCNALNAYLPALFEKTNDYSELLLNLSVIDQEGVVYHLIHDIDEADFNIEMGGQVEIIGWLYQYYNTEPKAAAFAQKEKIRKDQIPAVTQLFTPDWIVRYMVENSLGRLWVEGHPDHENIKSNWKYYLEEAEQEPEVQTQLAEIRKEYAGLNPEDIRVIDPCMGSGHILVYCFDVLMEIYEAAGYSQRDAARSILENNIYGLDIDDRAFQLSYFALMMKARQYNRRILSADTVCHVHAICESNEVNKNQLQYFGADLSSIEKNNALNQMQGLIAVLYDAKEYGSILNVDNYDWNLLRRFVASEDSGEQMSLESYGIEKTQSLLYDLIAISELLTKKYHVVVTNPPYMGSSGMGEKLLSYVKNNYEDEKSDLSTVMMTKSSMLCTNNGFVAMINIPVWMFISSYSKLREKMIRELSFVNLLHLGRGVFGSDFGTTAFVICKSNMVSYRAIYRRLYEKIGNVDSLEQKEKWFFDGFGYYESKKGWFRKIPTTPIAYWLTEKAVQIFVDKPALREVADPRQGLATGDDNRFLRSWSEVPFNKIGFGYKCVEDLWDDDLEYAPFNKGGAFRKWYGNNNLVIRFSKTNYEELLNMGNHLPSRQMYFKEGITWSSLTAGDFSGRYCDEGFVFAGKGPMCFPYDNKNIKYLLGFLNSKLTSFYMQVFSSTTDFNQGPMRDLPLIMDQGEKRSKVEEMVEENIKIAKDDWDSYETSWDFECHPLIRIANEMKAQKNEAIRIAECFEKWEKICCSQIDKLKTNEEKINEIFIGLYGLEQELSPEIDMNNITLRRADVTKDIKTLISYAVGCMFGRYTINKPGLRYLDDIKDEATDDEKRAFNTTIIPIYDEQYTDMDISSRFVDFIKLAFGEKYLVENLEYISDVLGGKGTYMENIRTYFVEKFYTDFVAQYSYGNLGKKPIYLMFDSGKQNGFKCLIYLQKYSSDVIGSIRVDFLHNIQRTYESEIDRMQDSILNGNDSREKAKSEKRKDKLQKQLKECREYDEKLGHLALSRIELDLDDGIKANFDKLQTANDGSSYSVLRKI